MARSEMIQRVRTWFGDIVAGRPSTLTKTPQPVSEKVSRAVKLTRIRQVGLQNLRDHASMAFGRADQEAPEYLLSEVNTIRDVESIVARVFDRMLAISWKEGWTLESRNETARAYIERRVAEMEFMKWEPIDSIFRDAYKDLLAFSNCFILKIRNEDLSSGKEHVLGGRTLKPIAGLEVLDPVTMFPVRETKRDGKLGRLMGWVQSVEDEGETKFWRLPDILHIHYRRKGSHVFGTPLTIPVADDIRSLRRNEEYLDITSAKNAFPFYAYSVGDENQAPEVFENGVTEIDLVKQELESMPPEGIVVMPGHHSITPVPIQGSFVDIMPFIEYYRRRIVTGMGAALTDIGEGASESRGSALTVSQNLIDLMKDMQDTFEAKISLELFQELLLEAGATFKLSPANRVFMLFHEIDQESKEKKENHYLNLVEKSFITVSEGRNAIGMRELSDEDYEDMYFNKVTIPTEAGKLDKQGEVQIKVAKESPQPAIGGGTRTRTSQTGTNGTTSNRSRPENQSGKRGAAARKATRKDDYCGSNVFQDFSSDPSVREMPISIPARAARSVMQEAYGRAKDRILNRIKNRNDEVSLIEISNLIASTRGALTVTSRDIADRTEQHLRSGMDAGVKEFVTETGLASRNVVDLTPDAKTALTVAMDRLFSDLFSAVSIKLRQINQSESPVADMNAVFESFRFRIDIIARSEISAARNFGFAIAAREANIKTLEWTRRTDCAQCEKSNLTVNTELLIYDNVRAYVPNCGDKLRVPDDIREMIQKGNPDG